MRARRKACRAAKVSLTGGSSASSVAVSAACSIFLACGGSISLKLSSGPVPAPLSNRAAAFRRQWSSSLSTWELTQPSLIIPAAL
jgi:hypothetical protein